VVTFPRRSVDRIREIPSALRLEKPFRTSRSRDKGVVGFATRSEPSEEIVGEATRRILVVDGDPGSCKQIEESLSDRGLRCTSIGTASDALEAAEAEPPDLVIVDFYLPDLSGLGLCRLLREHPELSSVAIIVVAAQASEIDRVLVFEAGADDFLAKPFYPPELSARVGAVLRRLERRESGPAEGSSARFGNVRVDSMGGRLEVGGKRVDLTPTELEIFSFLASRAGKVVQRRQLIDRLWGPDAPPSERTVDTHVKSIRRKLGDVRGCLETVRGVGYRFTAPVDG
jgi:DNA-binding response OmpR family regulator